jgi:MFS family permease
MNSSDAAKIVFFASGTHFMVHVYENSFSGILRSLQKEWGSDYTALGNLGLPLFFFFGLMAIPGGWLSDRYGSKKILLACLFGAAAASFAASMTGEFFGFHPMIVLSVLLGCLGLFVGLYHPAGLSFISRGVEKRGPAMGIHGIFGNIGLALAPFLASGLAYGFGWRAAFLVLALPAAVLGVIFWMTHFKPQDGTGKGSGALRFGDLIPPPGGPHRFPPILILYTISAMNGLAYRLLLVYLPSYFRETLGGSAFFSMDPMVFGSLVTSGILLVGAVGQWFGGQFIEKGNPERLYALTFFGSVPLLWIGGALGGMVGVVTLCIFSALYFSLQPMKNVLLAHHAPKSAQGLTYGFIFFLEFGIGSFGSSLGGMMADRWGLGSIFHVTAILILAMAGLAALMIPVVAPQEETS